MDSAERTKFLPPQPYSNGPPSSYRYNDTANMSKPASNIKAIYVVLGLLVADAIISLAFLSTMVNFLHTVGGGPYRVTGPNGNFMMHGEPKGLLTNQGHTTNGAGGVAVVLIGFGGLIALIKEHKSRKTVGSPRSSTRSHH